MTPRPLERSLVGDGEAPAALTLVTWNVLADGLAFGNFLHAPEACLVWDSRGERILAELEAGLADRPDVLCLQEVDHHAFLAERLAARGYVGAHAPKAAGRDGCSLFVRSDRYELTEVETLRFHDPATQEPHSQLSLWATLCPVGGGRSIRVASTHLKAKSGFEAARGAQAQQLAEAAAACADPVVIAGDFNDVPGSPAHAAMAAVLTSAYPGVLGEEPSWTTWKTREAGEKKRTIDFVWHSPQLTPLACLAVPADEQVDPGRLPSWQYPSDHLSLAVRFAVQGEPS